MGLDRFWFSNAIEVRSTVLCRWIYSWRLSVEKPKTVRSSENVAMIRSMPCSVCARFPVEVHHWTTKGAGGGDGLENLVSLCTQHHREFHDKGAKTFWRKYGKAIQWFRERKNLPLLREPK
jgi:hypothetical protein